MKKKIVLAGMAGNALEFYDFTLFGALSVILSQKFFPATDPFAAFLSTLATFAIGFIARPLGAVFLGHIGDRLGRKKALLVSIFMMAIPTFLIGVLPTYQTIGPVAPFVLLICRLFQGICAGGEYNGSAIFLIEHSKHKKNFAGSLAAVAGTFGCLLGVGVGALAIQPFMPDWMWRVPFIMGLVLGFVGLYFRSKIDESPEFLNSLQRKEIKKVPLMDILKTHKKSVFSCLLGAAFAGTLGSAFIAYIPIYLNRVVSLPMYKSLFYNMFGMFLYILFAPIAGHLADRYGSKKIMLTSSLIIFLSSFPIFVLLRTGNLYFIFLAQSLLCIFAAGFCAPMNAFMSSLFPTSLRYSGITLGYGLGMAAFGGLMPFVSTYLIEKIGYVYCPAFYIMTLSVGGMFAILLNKDSIANPFPKQLIKS